MRIETEINTRCYKDGLIPLKDFLSVLQLSIDRINTFRYKHNLKILEDAWTNAEISVEIKEGKIKIFFNAAEWLKE